MNWGNKLLLVFALFGGMISYMVYRCMQTPVDLVSNQYYKEELAYQKVIDGTRRANALSAKVSLAQVGGLVLVNLPAEMNGKVAKGTIVFYCPNDAGRDRSFVLNVDGDGRQELAKGAVPNGHYTVKVSWESAGVGYFEEQSFVIQ